MDEATEAVRPIMLVGDTEYVLSDEDARDMARAVLDMARHPEDYPSGAPGRLPEDSEDEWIDGDGLEQEPSVVELKHGIIGSDNRTSISNTSFPANNVGAMSVVVSGTRYACSAFKFGPHTAATAAHCVHNGTNWLTKKDIGFGGQATFLPSACYTVSVPACWDGSDESCDYAAIALRGLAGAWCDENNYDVGNLGWQSVGSNYDIHAYTTGYPDDHQQAGWTYGVLAYHWRGGGYGGSWYTDMVFYTNDAAGGQSGANYTSYYGGTDWRVRGIQKGQYDSSENWAREFDSSLAQWLQINGGY